jgi:hypothetical protein
MERRVHLDLARAIKGVAQLLQVLRPYGPPAAWVGTVFGPRAGFDETQLPLRTRPWFLRMVTYIRSGTPQNTNADRMVLAVDLRDRLAPVQRTYSRWLESKAALDLWRSETMLYEVLDDPRYPAFEASHEFEIPEAIDSVAFLAALREFLDWYRAYPFTEAQEAGARFWWTQFDRVTERYLNAP